MLLSVHQPQYLPWLGFFSKINMSDCFVILDNVQYKKREFQNRNKIRTAKGFIWLTVPVVTKGRFHQKIKEVKIDNSVSWQQKHLRSITTNYGKAKFFKKYSSFLEDIYLKSKWQSLNDLNCHIINYTLKELAIDTKIYTESSLDIEGSSTDRIINICKTLAADTYLSGSGAKAYLEEEKFKASGIGLCYQEFKHPNYPQAFKDFEPQMSVLDLLLNCGPESRNYLK